MKEYHLTHKQLVYRIATWFKNRHKSCIVMAEFVTAAQEIPDVLVMQSGAHSVLVECKASRADFLSDKNKFFRRQEDYGVGDNRFYAAPVGMLKPDELPAGWGLLEVGERQIREVAEPKPKEANKRRECIMLMSALRRLEISTSVFIRQEEAHPCAEKPPQDTAEAGSIAYNTRDEILPGQCHACHGCGNVMVSHVNECSQCNGTGKTSSVPTASTRTTLS